MSNNVDEASAATDGELPGYSRAEPSSTSREWPEHVYSLDKTQLSLKVKSRAPSATNLPLFFDGDTITGSVEMNVEKPESAKSVTISVSSRFAFCHGNAGIQ